MKKKWLWLGGAVVVAGALVAMVSRPAPGRTDCDALREEIQAKVEANGVRKFSLRIVDNGAVEGGKVVGSCDGGTKKIVYARE